MSTVTLEMLGQVVLAAGDSGDGDPRMFGLILFASGFVFYGLVYLRYRNTDKRHHHESETEARILDVQAWDQFVELKKGVKNARMRGANNREVRGARKDALAGVVPDAVGGVIRRLTD
jgi:hypothetical protein